MPLLRKQKLRGRNPQLWHFLTNVLDFLIIAFVIFIVIRQINRLKKPAPAPVTTKDCPYCQSTINIKAVKCPNCTADLEDITVGQ